MKISYVVSSRPYYDTRCQGYYNILSINKEPVGPLREIVQRISPNKLSDYQTNQYNNCCDSYSQDRCIYAIKNFCGDSRSDFLCIDNISELFTFLMNNGYTIDNSLTNLMRKAPMKQTNPLMLMVTYESGPGPI